MAAAWPRFLLTSFILLAPLQHSPPPASGAWDALELSLSLRRLLDTGNWDATPRRFRIGALSFLADGCAAEARREPTRRQAARACVVRCLELARHTSARPQDAESGDGLWLTHYTLILGAADTLGPCPQPRRHQAIAAALARRSLRDPHRHVASYTGRGNRWPADQAATLASISRCDRAHGTELHQAPLRAWREFVLAHAMDRALGLPWSEVTGRDWFGREPRGCALSWQTRYLHEFDEPLARQWWAAYRKHYLVEHLGLSGFREWPPGRNRPADADSGPIVAGVGAAASGLGIAAARVMGDETLARRLERTAALVDPVAFPSRAARNALADAIRYLGAQARR